MAIRPPNFSVQPISLGGLASLIDRRESPIQRAMASLPSQAMQFAFSRRLADEAAERRAAEQERRFEQTRELDFTRRHIPVTPGLEARDQEVDALDLDVIERDGQRFARREEVQALTQLGIQRREDERPVIEGHPVFGTVSARQFRDLQGFQGLREVTPAPEAEVESLQPRAQRFNVPVPDELTMAEAARVRATLAQEQQMGFQAQQINLQRANLNRALALDELERRTHWSQARFPRAWSGDLQPPSASQLELLIASDLNRDQLSEEALVDAHNLRTSAVFPQAVELATDVDEELAEMIAEFGSPSGFRGSDSADRAYERIKRFDPDFLKEIMPGDASASEDEFRDFWFSPEGVPVRTAFAMINHRAGLHTRAHVERLHTRGQSLGLIDPDNPELVRAMNALTGGLYSEWTPERAGEKRHQGMGPRARRDGAPSGLVESAIDVDFARGSNIMGNMLLSEAGTQDVQAQQQVASQWMETWNRGPSSTVEWIEDRARQAEQGEGPLSEAASTFFRGAANYIRNGHPDDPEFLQDQDARWSNWVRVLSLLTDQYFETGEFAPQMSPETQEQIDRIGRGRL